jgi:hypothetical protein
MSNCTTDKTGFSVIYNITGSSRANCARRSTWACPAVSSTFGYR